MVCIDNDSVHISTVHKHIIKHITRVELHKLVHIVNLSCMFEKQPRPSFIRVNWMSVDLSIRPF